MDRADLDVDGLEATPRRARYPIHDAAHKLTDPDESPRIGFEALSALARWLGSRDERSAGVDLDPAAPGTTRKHSNAPGTDGLASDAQLADRHGGVL